jgi:UDP-glucose 4-epimerase
MEESADVNPISPYAEGKALAENLLTSMFESYGGSITIFRATSVFHENLEARVLSRIRTEIAKQNDFELFGHGTETRDYIYMDSLLGALNMIIEKKSSMATFSLLNLGSGKSLDLKKVVELALVATGSKSLVNFNGKKRDGDPNSMCVSISKISKFIDFPTSDPIPKLLSYFLN